LQQENRYYTENKTSVYDIYNITFAERLTTKTGNFQTGEISQRNVHAIQLYSVGLPVSPNGIPVPRSEAV
jgi:hypothetical protein